MDKKINDILTFFNSFVKLTEFLLHFLEIRFRIAFVKKIVKIFNTLVTIFEPDADAARRDESDEITSGKLAGQPMENIY